MGNEYRYTIEDEELKDIFKKYVKRHVFSGHKPSRKSPVLALLGAQPAAGKTKAANALASRHQDMVVLIGDELRQYHPDYARAMRENPEAMPDITAQASGKWIGMSIDYARSRGYNLLIEGTFRDTGMVVDNAETFQTGKKAGIPSRFLPLPSIPIAASSTQSVDTSIQAKAAGRVASPTMKRTKVSPRQ